MYSTSDFRKGLKIEYNGEPYLMVDFQHVKPGKGNAFTRTRLKNLITGNVLEVTFKSGEKVNRPDLEEKEMQFLYKEGENYNFMDTVSYEQLSLSPDIIGELAKFLQENINVSMLFYRGKPIGIDLPNFVILKVVTTEPGIRGDTASGGSKPATLETGAIIQVPLFINEGELIKVDTRSGEYVERA
ncbi:MAG: elongation factor P [Myxococcota bacterium]